LARAEQKQKAYTIPIVSSLDESMNPAIIVVALLCFLASAASLYRSKTLPPDKQVGGHGIYIDKFGYRLV
jgi:hypothetical protein